MIKRFAFVVFAAQLVPRVSAFPKSIPVKSYCSSSVSMSAFDDLGKARLLHDFDYNLITITRQL